MGIGIDGNLGDYENDKYAKLNLDFLILKIIKNVLPFSKSKIFPLDICLSSFCL